MRIAIVAAAAAFLSAPAFADTLENILAKGIVLSVQGMEIPITYNADNTFTGDFQGQTFTGSWRRDGDKLCTTSDMQPQENCQAYPAGKNPGDSFDIEGQMGTVTIKINE